MDARPHSAIAPTPAYQQRAWYALCVGVVVAVLVFVAAWQSISGDPRFRPKQLGTNLILRDLAELVDEYRKEHGALPESLEALHARRLNDAWGRPIHYRVNGERYELRSLGRDGLSGGKGWDADLVPNDNGPWVLSEAMPLLQWIQTEDAPRIGPIVVGIFAAVCAWIMLTPQVIEQRSPPAIVLRLAWFTAVVVGVGGFLAQLHIPTGH